MNVTKRIFIRKSKANEQDMCVVTWIVLTLLAVPSWLRSTTLTLSSSSVLASLLLTTWL